MKTEQRLPQAPRQTMPELAEFLGQFQVRFAKPKRSSVVERYVTGLLTEHPNKNCETMAEVVPGTNEQQLNNLLTEMHWEEQDLNRQRVQLMSHLRTEGDGVLIIDDTGFGKKGDQSVGVAPQYTGTLGKVANCQITVNCHYGDNPNFLNGLEARQARYVAGVDKDFSVASSAHAPTQRAETLLASIPRRQWWSHRWREGTKGKLRARFVAVRCWRVDGDGQRHIGWLLGQKSKQGQTLEHKYFWSNFGPQVPPERFIEYAHRRYWVEQYHEEAKGELGWDQFQGRRWDGFHRNAVLVMLSYSFLVWQEWQERQTQSLRGRRRRAFSPSARPAAALLTQPASSGGRLAPNCRRSGDTPEATHRNLQSAADLTK